MLLLSERIILICISAAHKSALQIQHATLPNWQVAEEGPGDLKLDLFDSVLKCQLGRYRVGDIQCAGITNELLTFLSNIHQYSAGPEI